MKFGKIAFAIGMIASGVLAIAKRDLYPSWDPTWIPSHTALAYACGTLMVLGGIGLVINRTAAISARVLFAFTLFWLVLIKVPYLVTGPQPGLQWLNWGKIAVVVAGAWTLATTNETQLRAARYLMGVGIVPIGISHFLYIPIAVNMVPGVLPFHSAWVIFTGIAHIAAGLAVIAGVLVWLATMLEASMITAFMVLVWLAPAFAAPGDLNRWVPVVSTLVTAAGVWAVVSKMPRGASGR